MAQGIFAGCTDYKEQTLEDILEDIGSWKNMLSNTIQSIEQKLEAIESEQKINSIGYDFRMTIYSSLKCFQTFISDFNMISSAIEKNQITAREIKLLANIAKKAFEYDNDYSRTWNIDHYGWKCYGEKWFYLVEDMYSQGRDMAITLKDCSNVRKRLEDYQVEGNVINQQNIINGSGNISGINNGTMNVINNNSTDLTSEASEAIQKISKLNCPEETKQPFLDLLTDISDNKLTGETAELHLNSIKSLNLSKCYEVLSVLSTFATLASFCGIQF